MLVRQARWAQIGAAVGMVVFGLMAWRSSLGTAIVIAGAGVLLFAPWVALRFTEHEFTPTRENRLGEARAIFRRGLELARGAEAFDWLYLN